MKKQTKWDKEIILRWLSLRGLPKEWVTEYNVRTCDFLGFDGNMTYGHLITRKRRRKNGKVN